MFKTEQETFWASNFGKEYIERNSLTPQIFASTLNHWSNMLQKMSAAPVSVLELGSNIGRNLYALDMLLPGTKLSAIEINPEAATRLRQWGKAEVFESSILEFTPQDHYDLVFTSGVLIHIAPENLQQVYELMYTASGRYICMAEYYSPHAEERPYRGHAGKMYRRDFAGEIMAKYPDLILRGYGCTYLKDPVFPLDDFKWFVMEKL